MNARLTLVVTWIVTGACAVIGSILGNAFSPRGLSAGALLGGVIGVFLSVSATIRFGWLPATARVGGILGGLVGFAVAAPIAILNLQSPVAPIASCALVGAGVLFGAGIARRG